jgi:hypothetical protein
MEGTSVPSETGPNTKATPKTAAFSSLFVSKLYVILATIFLGD